MLLQHHLIRKVQEEEDEQGQTVLNESAEGDWEVANKTEAGKKRKKQMNG